MMKKGQKSIENNFYKPSRGNNGGQRRRHEEGATAFVLCQGQAAAAQREVDISGRLYGGLKPIAVIMDGRQIFCLMVCGFVVWDVG